jgi:hypothetical protein
MRSPARGLGRCFFSTDPRAVRATLRRSLLPPALLYTWCASAAVGKTMTAEALAGHFGRPLYCLTFGELGSTVPELEVCVTWLADREYMDQYGGLQCSRAELPFFRREMWRGASVSPSLAWVSSLVYEAW